MSISAGITSVVTAITGNTVLKVLCGLAGGLLLAGLLALGVRYIYNKGYDAADQVRRAEVAELQRDHAKALAEAEVEARRRLEVATQRASRLARQYMAARQKIKSQSQELTNQRITDANNHIIADGSCRFGPEWVRLYNEAIGASAGNGGDAVPAAASDPDANATAGAAVETGILQEQVTPEDILAHARDYGERNREMEAQLGALIEWANGLNSVGDRP